MGSFQAAAGTSKSTVSFRGPGAKTSALDFALGLAWQGGTPRALYDEPGDEGNDFNMLMFT